MPAFPGTGILDTFTGTAGTNDPNMLEISGVGSFGRIKYDPTGTQGVPTTGFAWTYWAPTSFGANCEAYVRISGGVADTIRIGGRITNAGTATYQGYFVMVSAAGVWTIVKVTNGGAPVTLATGLTQPLINQDKVGIKIVGSTITGYWWNGTAWAVMVTVNDTTFTGAGRIGVEFRNQKIDDFGGGAAGASGMAIAGTFLCGTRLAGQLEIPIGVPKLRLQGRPFSVLALGNAVVVQPPRSSMRLQGKAFGVNISSSPPLGAPKLRLKGVPFGIIFSVGPTYATPAVMRLQGKTFTLRLDQSPQFGKPVMHLLGLRLGRVGIPGLVPTVPETVTLTPSPIEVGILTPSPPEVGLLTPSPLRNA